MVDTSEELIQDIGFLNINAKMDELEELGFKSLEEWVSIQKMVQQCKDEEIGYEKYGLRLLEKIDEILSTGVYPRSLLIQFMSILIMDQDL